MRIERLAAVAALCLVTAGPAAHRGWPDAPSAVGAARLPSPGARQATAAAVDRSSREGAYRSNNIGVARLEQYDFDAAAAAFQEALRLAPDLPLAHFNLALAYFYGGKPDAARTEAEAAASRLPSPHAHYLLGLIARVQDRPEDAVREFQKALEIDKEDVGTRVNLGQVYTQQRQYAQAIALLRDAVAGEPYNATAAYGLAMALTRSGDPGGPAAMQRFEALRGTPYARTYAQTYLEQGHYAEALASTGAEADLVDAAVPPVTFADATPAAFRSSAAAPAAPPAGPVPAVQGPTRPPAPGVGSLVLADINGDGRLDVVEAGGSGVRLYRGSSSGFEDVTASSGIGATAGGAARAAVAGDYDNDGRPDVLVLEDEGARLIHQRADGRFEAGPRLPSFPHRAASAAFVDVDHDGDLDIFMAGAADRDARAAPNQLVRNNGDGTFADITAEAKVAGGDAPSIGIVPTDFDNRRDIDLLVVRRGARALLYQNVRDGSFRDSAEAAGLPGSGEYTAVAAGDINKDGFPDFFLGRLDGPGVFALSDGRGRFVTSQGPPESAGAVAALLLDYDNDGLLDLFVLSSRGPAISRNLGDRWVDVSAQAGLATPAFQAVGSGAFQSLAAGDLDGDGDTDVMIRLATGDLRLWRNDGGSQHPAVRVRLEAQQSNRSGAGAKVDMRAGSLRQRLETSAAVPAVAPADLLFGLGARRGADVVRVLWPSGTVQAELLNPVPGGAASAPTVTVTELNRKPSSCPYLFTWNGSAFEFITDFMGGGELGYWLAPGQHAAPDPDEYVRIDGRRLQPRNGRYEIRVTNELEEALFADRFQLVAVDHPAGTEVYPNEGLKEPPLPPFALVTTREAHPPVSAVDDHGHDMRARIATMDRTYPDDFRLTTPRGFAEPHTLTLDLGADANRAVLLLTGWTDYAFSSDNVAGFQRGASLKPPSLEARDGAGAWRTIVTDIGIPVGRPQTVVVDLRGKLPHGHEVRVSTSMRIYWDQILVDTSGGGEAVRITRLDPASATLRWRGFSAEVTPDGREPYRYDYSRVMPDASWKVMPGRYTREGEVRELLLKADDMFVVSRPGDEVALSFDAAGFPPIPEGRVRTFLLYADGFSKEMDINSASPHGTDPLPFHGMTRYPYAAPEHYPSTDPYREYLARYNTRVVHGELPSLDSTTR